MVYPATAMQKFRTYIFPLLFIPLSVTVWGQDNVVSVLRTADSGSDSAMVDTLVYDSVPVAGNPAVQDSRYSDFDW